MANGMPSLTRVQSFFFEGMLRGWASDVAHNKVAHPSKPGWKLIQHQDGELVLTDSYCVGQMDEWGLTPSMGEKIITFRSQPLWVMHYGGAYTKPMIQVVKAALMQSYAEREFCGGRGPGAFGSKASASPFLYVNGGHGDFTRFEGYEEVKSSESEVKGWHWYHGLLLVPLSVD